jgi:hypothetical protein
LRSGPYPSGTVFASGHPRSVRRRTEHPAKSERRCGARPAQPVESGRKGRLMRPAERPGRALLAQEGVKSSVVAFTDVLRTIRSVPATCRQASISGFVARRLGASCDLAGGAEDKQRNNRNRCCYEAGPDPDFRSCKLPSRLTPACRFDPGPGHQIINTRKP